MDIIYRTVNPVFCYKCKVVITDAKEAIVRHDPRDGEYLEIKCAVCNDIITVHAYKIIS